MKKFVFILIILLLPFTAFADEDGSFPPWKQVTDEAISTAWDGLSSKAGSANAVYDILVNYDSDLDGTLDGATGSMSGYPTGAQPLDANLTDLAGGTDSRFNWADLKAAAPSSPGVGDIVVADGLQDGVMGWNPGGLTTATITGGSDISFVEGGGSADTITDGGSGFVTAGFEVGMLIEVTSSTSNNGYYFLTAVAAGTLTISGVDEGTGDGDLVDEANTSAKIDGGFPHVVQYDGDSWVTKSDIAGNDYIKEFQFDGDDDSYGDAECVGITVTGTGGDTIAVGDVVYLSASDGRWELADSDSTTAQANEAKGLAATSSTDGTAVTVLLKGVMHLDAWTWTDNEGYPLYLHTTAGDLTETRPTSATTAVQQVATIISDQDIFVDPKPIDYGITRYATDADGETLTCLESSNTIWTLTGAATITLPGVASCSTVNMTLIAYGANSIDLDVDGADKMLLDGVLLDDGDEATSGGAAGDQITCSYMDATGVVCQSNSWTDD